MFLVLKDSLNLNALFIFFLNICRTTSITSRASSALELYLLIWSNRGLLSFLWSRLSL